MKTTPTPQQPVQSQDSEVAQNKNNTQQPVGGACSVPLGTKDSQVLPNAPAVPDQKGNSYVPLQVGRTQPSVEQEGSPEGGQEDANLRGEEGDDAGKGFGYKDASGSVLEPIEEDETIPKSIRLQKTAFAALKVLMEKYGKNMAEMTSIAIFAYAKKAAAAAIVRYRMLDPKCLFPLQASATDIKIGLSQLEKDLYKARKSRRDLKERKLLYYQLSDEYQKVLRHAEETLTMIAKECVIQDLLEPCDHELLMQAIVTLKAAKPKAGTETQIRDLSLKIFEAIIR